MLPEVRKGNCPFLSPILDLLRHHWSLNWARSQQGSLKLHLTTIAGAPALCQAWGQTVGTTGGGATLAEPPARMAPRTPAGLRASVGQGEVERAGVWASQGWVAEGDSLSSPRPESSCRWTSRGNPTPGVLSGSQSHSPSVASFYLHGTFFAHFMVKKMKLRGEGFAHGHTAGCGGLRPVLGPHDPVLQLSDASPTVEATLQAQRTEPIGGGVAVSKSQQHPPASWGGSEQELWGQCLGLNPRSGPLCL